MRLVCLGFGYVAQAVARRATPDELVGTARDAAAAEARLASLGGVGVGFAGGAASKRLLEAVESASHVLVSIPPGDQGCPAFHGVGDVLARRGEAWVGYLSATSVYGDRGGGWCFEWEAPRPTSARGEARALAESQWLGLPEAATVFRLPGIYGPGRSALDAVRAGQVRRWRRPDHVFNRAHVEDIASAVLLSAARGRDQAGAIYNIADDRPAPQGDVTVEACRLLGVDPPAAEPWDPDALSARARAFWAEHKRVSNALAKGALGWRPQYPTFCEGLAAVMAATA